MAAGDRNSSHAEHAGVLHLPKEAQPLDSLFWLACDVLRKWEPESGSGRSSSKHGTSVEEAAGAGKAANGLISSKRKRQHGKHESHGDEAAKKQKNGAGHPATNDLQPVLKVSMHCLHKR